MVQTSGWNQKKAYRRNGPLWAEAEKHHEKCPIKAPWPAPPQRQMKHQDDVADEEEEHLRIKNMARLICAYIWVSIELAKQGLD